jgi:hypothetical protein
LSRHRITKCSPAKTAALIAVGAFTVAAAATATAASWAPGRSGPTAGRGHETTAGPFLAVTGRLMQMRAFEQSTASQAVQAYQVRDAAAELSAAHWQTARVQAAKKQAAKKQAAQKVAAVTVAAVTRAASRSPQHIAGAMLRSFGWSAGQFSCLEPLWAHESGWNVTAYNAGSGAYGIPQALPGSRMASAGPDWQTNAATQIRWGLEYIKGTYGSPCAAWDHEQATGWY